MKTKEVFDKWIGKKYAESKELGHQCVALAKLFAQEVGFPVKGFSGSALKGWQTGSPFVGTEWVRVENSISAFPISGSIIFFDKTPKNPYGHVAVVDSADTDSIIIVEQNAGSGNGNGVGANAITRRTVGYTARTGRGKCLGWYTMPVIKEDISLLNAEERIYREEVIRTGIQGVFIDHKGDEIITKGQVKSLIDTAVIRLLDLIGKK